MLIEHGNLEPNKTIMVNRFEKLSNDRGGGGSTNWEEGVPKTPWPTVPLTPLDKETNGYQQLTPEQATQAKDMVGQQPYKSSVPPNSGEIVNTPPPSETWFGWPKK